MILILDDDTKVNFKNYYCEKVHIDMLNKYYAAKMLKAFDTRDEFFRN